MRPEEIEKVKNSLSKAQSLIQEIENKTNLQLIAFICHQSITHRVVYRLNKIIRNRSRDSGDLALLIDSGGGDIDATSKIVKLLKAHCQKYVAVIPFLAKSAATLLAVSADEILMCKSGELGPVDPQVKDPMTKIWIPASSIKDTLDFLKETGDPLVKLSMAEKLPPLLLGAFRSAQNVSKQYISEAFEKLGEKKEEALRTFTDKYLSHGYPIDRDICKNLGLPVKFPEEDLENKISELLETYWDLLMDLEQKEAEEEEIELEKRTENLIIQTKSDRCVIIHGEDISHFI